MNQKNQKNRLPEQHCFRSRFFHLRGSMVRMNAESIREILIAQIRKYCYNTYIISREEQYC